jgi:hypothetical protein
MVEERGDPRGHRALTAGGGANGVDADRAIDICGRVVEIWGKFVGVVRHVHRIGAKGKGGDEAEAEDPVVCRARHAVASHQLIVP